MANEEAIKALAVYIDRNTGQQKLSKESGKKKTLKQYQLREGWDRLLPPVAGGKESTVSFQIVLESDGVKHAALELRDISRFRTTSDLLQALIVRRLKTWHYMNSQGQVLQDPQLQGFKPGASAPPKRSDAEHEGEDKPA